MKKVINKQKVYTAIKFDDSREFYINIGKYLKKDDYKLKKDNIYREFIFISDFGEIKLNIGDYILICEDEIVVINNMTYKNNFIEIKEEN